jgi:hypothetical protein
MEVSMMISKAALLSSPRLPLNIVVAADGTIADDEIPCERERATLILVPLRLNPNSCLGDVAAGLFQQLLSLPFCCGAVGGTNGHSVFILPSQCQSPAGMLAALDPHRTQMASESIEALSASLLALPTDYCEIDARRLDPSMTLGYLISSAAEFDEFKRMARAAAASPLNPLSFVPTRTVFESRRSVSGGSVTATSHPVDRSWVDAADEHQSPRSAASGGAITPLRLRVWRWMVSLARTLQSKARDT